MANADHFHFSGGVRWSGGVHVGASWHFARPAWRPNWGVRGSIYVGPTYYYPRPYYVYYPYYVPSYYATSYYYPVEAQPTVAAPGTVAVVQPRPPLPRFGLGLYAGGSSVATPDGGSTHESSDMGLLARFRLTDGLLIEGELGKTSYDVDGVDNARVDRRLGASLVYEIGARNALAPYLLAGMGAQQADVGDGMYQTTQDFVELGAGLRLALSRSLHLTLDIRAGSRDTVSSSGGTAPVSSDNVARTITPPPADSNENENYTRVRLAGILYF